MLTGERTGEKVALSHLGAEALQIHQSRVLGPDAARMDRRVVSRILLAQKMTAVDLVEVLQTRTRSDDFRQQAVERNIETVSVPTI